MTVSVIPTVSRVHPDDWKLATSQDLGEAVAEQQCPDCGRTQSWRCALAWTFNPPYVAQFEWEAGWSCWIDCSESECECMAGAASEFGEAARVADFVAVELGTAVDV